MIGFAALNGVPLAGCDAHAAVRAPDWFSRIVCFCSLHQVFHDAKTVLFEKQIALDSPILCGIKDRAGLY